MWPLDQADPARIGPYRLLARLGEGGMGTVYLAVGGGGERVALKSIRYGFTEDPDFRVRFAREIEAASLVRAGGIAQVVAAEPGADGQRPWVATEFVPGLPLQRLVATQGPLPAASAGALAAGLARALEAVHAAGLVHRDVKPSNILLTVEGPRLIDFGVAKLVDASTGGGLTRTGASVGSPGYMSPEQVLGRALTPASDVFGLGGVLVFAATGRLPFPVPDPTNQHALMYAVVQDSPALDDVPDELRPLVAECLAKDPALASRLAPYAALLDGDGNGAGSAGAGAGAVFADPWLPARALAEVARISGRAAAQGEWRPGGAGGEAAGSTPEPVGPGPAAGSGAGSGAGAGAGSPSEPPAASAAAGSAPSAPPAAGHTPSAPPVPGHRQPVSPPPPPSAPLAYVPTIAAAPGPAPQAAPRPPGSVPPPTPPERPAAAPPARAPEPAPAPADPARPHYVFCRLLPPRCDAGRGRLSERDPLRPDAVGRPLGHVPEPAAHSGRRPVHRRGAAADGTPGHPLRRAQLRRGGGPV